MDKDLITVAVDLATGKITNYGKAKEVNDTLREAFSELVGYSKESGKIDYRTFRRNKIEVFELIEEILDIKIDDRIRNNFENLVEYRNLAHGDSPIFHVPDKKLFRVAMVSDGNGNLRRDRLRDGQDIIPKTYPYAIEIGEELLRFLSGRIDWMGMIDLIAESFERDLSDRIYKALYNSYGKLNVTYHETFTSIPTEDDLLLKAMHVQADTGLPVGVYGTKLALRKLAPNADAISDNMRDQRNTLGYYGQIAGLTLYEIPQYHKFGTDEFAIDNNFVLLLPETPDKLIKVINEGDSIIVDGSNSKNSDFMLEYTVINKFGIEVLITQKFGFLKW